MKKISIPKHYLLIAQDGQVRDAGKTNPTRLEPDGVLCRRVADYQHGPPAAAAIGPCSRCGHPVAWDPRGPHQQAPRVCLQCVDIVPLPYEEP